MTEQPIEPREQGEEQNPETVSPQPDVETTDDPEEASSPYSDALSGSGVGSDTRAGSLRGASASGSEGDTDQQRIDYALKSEGRSDGEPKSVAADDSKGLASQESVNNVGQPNLGAHGDPAEGKRGGDVDAASG